MCTVFRLPNGERITGDDSWQLAESIQATQAWLSVPENAARVRGATLDIGFNSRVNTFDSQLGDTVAVQGETIPVDFMRRLVELEITLWLSLYPPFCEEKAVRA